MAGALEAVSPAGGLLRFGEVSEQSNLMSNLESEAGIRVP